MTAIHILNVHRHTGEVERSTIDNEVKKSLLDSAEFVRAVEKGRVRLLRADYTRKLLALSYIKSRSPDVLFSQNTVNHG